MSKLVAALLFLGLNFYIYEFLASEELIPPRESFEAFPLELGDWRCAATQEMDARSLRFLGASDYVICDFHKERTESWVDLYVGYHASQVRKEGGGGDASAIHPPEHCLPGSGWDIIQSRTVAIDFPGLPTGHSFRSDGPTAKRFVIAKGKSRQLVYFWYQTQGRVITANEDVILYRFWDRATTGRTDGSLVRLTAPIRRGDIERAEAEIGELASLLSPVLPRFVPN